MGVLPATLATPSGYYTAGMAHQSTPYDIDRLRATLAAAGMERVEYRQVTGSTNRDLHDLLSGDEPLANHAVILADQQTAGRGRLGRVWSAPPATQLIASIAITHVDPQRIGTLPLACGVGIVTALRELTGLPVRLKWPNDVILTGADGYHKLSGILGEVVGEQALIGFGVNHLLTAEDLPVPTATSLLLEGIDIDRTTLAEGVLTHVAHWLTRWEEDTFDLDAYRQVCATVGQSVRALLPGGEVITGTATDITTGGDLVIVTGRGDSVTVSAGDVEHLR